jgi:glycosyltransferase involved in cell wall biosynthesis
VIERDDIEVLLVDNGSTDETAELLAEASAERRFLGSVRVEVNQGYGHGILAGLRVARGGILAWTHADLQTDPGDAIRGLALFEAAAVPEQCFVKGRRHGRPLADIAFTAGMAGFESLLLGRAMWDINAQPTMFPRAFFETWVAPPDDFSLDLYAYYQAKVRGLEIERFPVRFGERAHGVSHWNVDWRAKLRFIRRTMSYSFGLRRRLKGGP